MVVLLTLGAEEKVRGVDSVTGPQRLQVYY